MSKHNRILLALAFLLAVLLGTVYLSFNQSDKVRNVLLPGNYPDDITSDFMMLDRGTYTVTFGYVYKEPGTVQIVRANMADENNRLPLVLASGALNESGETVLTLTLSQTVYDLQYRYSKATELGFTVTESIGPVWRDTALALLLIAAVGAWLLWQFYREQTRALPGPSEETLRESTILCILTAAAVYVTLPVLRDFLTAGLDLPFHLLRIEGIRDGLISGQFPVRVAPVFSGGIGYASSTLYPELLLYIPALLRLCGVSLPAAYQCFVFLINLATMLVTYYAMKKLTGKAAFALIVSLVYGLGVYRITGLYNRVFLGETLAMLFFPCVLLGMAETLHRNKFSAWLVAGMTGLIQTHVVSLELSLLFCALYTAAAVILRKTTARALLKLCAAAAVTVLLNLWFLVPFLRFAQEDFNMFSYLKKTMLHAVYPQQLFASFLQPFGISLPLGQTADEMPLSVGLLPGLGMLLYLLTARAKKDDPLRPLGRASLLLGLASLAAASTLFPWTYVLQIPVLGEWLNSIQFPSRFLSIGSLFLSIVFAVAACALAGEKHTRALIAVCVVLALFTAAPVVDQYIQSDRQTVVMAGKTDRSFTGIDPLRDYYDSDSDFAALAAQPMRIAAPDAVRITGFAKDGLRVSFRYASDTQQTVTLPLYGYPGYAATLDGEPVPVSEGGNHMLALQLPAGGGDVRVLYAGLRYYPAANLVSLGAALALLSWALVRRFSKRAPKGGAAC